MILFLNVIITDDTERLHDRGRFGIVRDQLSVFKYALASLAVLPFDHVYIYCELGPSYTHRTSELEEYTYSLFPRAELEFRRNVTQKEWQESLEKLFAIQGDELVWYACEHDHIFLDYDLEVFNEVIAALKKRSAESSCVSACVSDWPQTFPYYRAGYGEGSRRNDTAALEIQRHFFVTQWSRYEGAQIVNYRLLKEWWCTERNATSGIGAQASLAALNSTLPIVSVIPFRELARRFNGSPTTGLDINAYPALSIPEGFFEEQVKILFGAPQRRPGYVHVNPLIEDYRVVDPYGVDIRGVIEDLPLFWRTYICETTIESDQPRTLLLRRRNEAFIKKAAQVFPGTFDELSERIAVGLRTEGMNEALPAAHAREVTPHSMYESNFSGDKSKTPKISFIIADGSREFGDSTTLQSLHQQTVARDTIEIVWVPIGDQAISHAQLAQADIVLQSHQERYRVQGSYHKGRALNAGLAAALGELVVFADEDTFFSPQFTETLLQHFPRSSAALLFHEVPIVEGKADTSLARPIAIAASRSELLSLGGFDEHDQFCGEVDYTANLILRLQKTGKTVTIDSGTLAVGRVQNIARELPYTPQTYSPTDYHPRITHREIALLQGMRGSHDQLVHALEKTLSDGTSAILDHAPQRAYAYASRLKEASNPLAARVGEALLLLLEGKHTEARAALTTAASELPQSGEVATLLGLCAFTQGQTGEARAALQRAVTLNGSSRLAQELLAKILTDSGNPAEASICYAALARHYPRTERYLEAYKALRAITVATNGH